MRIKSVPSQPLPNAILNILSKQWFTQANELKKGISCQCRRENRKQNAQPKVVVAHSQTDKNNAVAA